MAADEQIPNNGAPCGLLHFYCVKCGRLPYAGGGPAIVFGLSQRYSVLVGGSTLLADVGGGDRLPSWDFFCDRPPKLFARSERSSGSTGRTAGSMALSRRAKP